MFSIKKILILLVFICGFASLISKTEANASTYSLSDYVTISGIGHTINVVEANNVQDFIMGCTVLEPVFLEDVLQLYRFNSGHTNYFSGTYSSMADMYSDISDEIYSDYNVSGLYSGFYGSVSSTFSSSQKDSLNRSYNQFFGIKQFEYTNYKLALPNYSTFISTYGGYLDQDYYFALSDLYNSNNRNYIEFFENFGTHMIASAKYGCKLEAYYSVSSREKYFDSNVLNELNTKLNVIYNNIESGGNIKIENQTINSLVGYSHEKISHISAYGGSTSYTFSLENGAGVGIFSWENSVDDSNSVLIGYDRLIGLWEILPSEFSSMSYEMENAFNQYSHDAYNAFLNDFDYRYVHLMDGTTSQLIEKRGTNDIYRITHDGRFINPYDIIYFENDLDITLSMFKAQGFLTVDIEIRIQVREINDGYQYIFIYQNEIESENSNNVLLGATEFEHGVGTLNSSYSTHIFHFDDISIFDFSSDSFVIRYGASGVGNDTWMNRLLEVKVTLNK